MATWELQLISRIVRTGDLNSVIGWGINPDDFLTNEGRALFASLLGYFSMPETSGAVLGPYAVQRMFPNFQLCDDVSMTTDALCVEVRKQRLSIELQNRTQAVLELVQYDPILAINRMQAAAIDLQNIGMSRNTDVHFHHAFDRVMRNYYLRKQGVDLSCGAWPWLPLQLATLGLQPDDYVVIYGRPKSMKSWVLAFLIAWFYTQGKRLLIYTKEMTADNIFQRAGAVLAEVRYQEFRSATLTWEEEMSLYSVGRMLHHAQMSQTVVCLSAKDATDGSDTVPWFRSKIEQYKPQAAFIDGMYLMTDAKGARKDHERVRNISRSIRQMILDTGVPTIATIQANRAAAKNQSANLDEIAFSDAIGQDATLLMRAINEMNKPTIALVMSGATREFSLNGFRIYGQPAVNFDYAGEITDKEIEKAKEQDVDSEDGDSKNKPAARRANGITEAKSVIQVTRALDPYLATTPNTPKIV
jgi:DnaB helicase-like protein